MLAAAVPETALREILKHIDDETTRLQESIADPTRSKSRRERDIDHAQAEICAELKTIKRHNGDIIPNVPKRALAKAWEQHRCSVGRPVIRKFRQETSVGALGRPAGPTLWVTTIGRNRAPAKWLSWSEVDSILKRTRRSASL